MKPQLTIRVHYVGWIPTTRRIITFQWLIVMVATICWEFSIEITILTKKIDFRLFLTENDELPRRYSNIQNTEFY